MVQRNGHQFFVVRSWCEHDDTEDRKNWRFVLEGPANTDRQGFSDAEALLQALRQKLQQISQDPSLPTVTIK